MQDRISARPTKALATHGRTIHWVNNAVLVTRADGSFTPESGLRPSGLGGRIWAIS
jgi:hypothetical protein